MNIETGRRRSLLNTRRNFLPFTGADLHVMRDIKDNYLHINVFLTSFSLIVRGVSATLNWRTWVPIVRSATERLEKAFIQDDIQASDYEAACERLITQVRAEDAMKPCSLSLQKSPEVGTS